MRKQQILMRNFELTDQWARVPIYGISVKYYAHLDGRIVSLPNRAYIERLEHYGRRVRYDTAKVIQDAPFKKAEHCPRVTLTTAAGCASFLRHNAVWAAWHDDPEMLAPTNAKKYKALTFIDGNPANCALSNLEIRKDYCRCSNDCAEAYRREWRWIVFKLMADYDSRISVQTAQDIASESFVLTMTRLYGEGNDSHRIGIFWLSVARRLTMEVISKSYPVNYYTRNLNIAYASG